MAGLLEGDYQAVLKALGAGQRTGLRGQSDSNEMPQRAQIPSVRDVADLLELNPSTAPAVSAQTPEPTPPWNGQLRLMDFDMPCVSGQPTPPPEDER